MRKVPCDAHYDAHRFREIPRTLCWTVPTLAQLLAIEVKEVHGWHDALEPVPANAANWLQTLVKVHEAHPPQVKAAFSRVAPQQQRFVGPMRWLRRSRVLVDAVKARRNRSTRQNR